MLDYLFLKNVKVSRVKFHDVICRGGLINFLITKIREVKNEVAR